MSTSTTTETVTPTETPEVKETKVILFQAFQSADGKEVKASKKFTKLNDGYKAAMLFQQHMSQEKDVKMARKGERMNESNPSRRFWQGTDKDGQTILVSVRRIVEIVTEK